MTTSGKRSTGERDRDDRDGSVGGPQTARRAEIADGTPRESADGKLRTILLVAAPDLPRRLARDLARRLPGLLGREDGSWRVTIDDEPLIHDAPDVEDVAATLDQRRRRTSSDLAIGLTDVPLRAGARPIVAAMGVHVAVLAVPALGATRLRPRTREAVAVLVAEIAEDAIAPRHSPALLRRRLGDLFTPIRKVRAADATLTIRYVLPVASGHLRLLAGMVRANRPWRAVAGLSYAVIAALATGAYAILNTFVLRLSYLDGVLRLAGITLAVVIAIVTFLVVTHNLWEPVNSEGRRKDAVLYNAATVITLVVAVLVAYALLFLGVLVAAALLIDPAAVPAGTRGAVGLGDYARIAWLGASIASVAGALGSELQSLDEIQQAAYGYNHRRRHRRRCEEEADRSSRSSEHSEGDRAAG